MPYFNNIDCSKMVQEYGTKSNAISAISQKERGFASDSAFKKVTQYGSKQNSSLKSGFCQKMDNNAQKYGAWGQFTNKEKFVNMHLF